MSSVQAWISMALQATLLFCHSSALATTSPWDGVGGSVGVRLAILSPTAFARYPGCESGRTWFSKLAIALPKPVSMDHAA